LKNSRIEQASGIHEVGENANHESSKDHPDSCHVFVGHGGSEGRKERGNSRVARNGSGEDGSRTTDRTKVWKIANSKADTENGEQRTDTGSGQGRGRDKSKLKKHNRENHGKHHRVVWVWAHWQLSGIGQTKSGEPKDDKADSENGEDGHVDVSVHLDSVDSVLASGVLRSFHSDEEKSDNGEGGLGSGWKSQTVVVGRNLGEDSTDRKKGARFVGGVNQANDDGGGIERNREQEPKRRDHHDGREGYDALEIELRAGKKADENEANKEGNQNWGAHAATSGVDDEDSRHDQGCGMEQRRDWGWTLHGLRKPKVGHKVDGFEEHSENKEAISEVHVAVQNEGDGDDDVKQENVTDAVETDSGKRGSERPRTMGPGRN